MIGRLLGGRTLTRLDLNASVAWGPYLCRQPGEEVHGRLLHRPNRARNVLAEFLKEGTECLRVAGPGVPRLPAAGQQVGPEQVILLTQPGETPHLALPRL